MFHTNIDSDDLVYENVMCHLLFSNNYNDVLDSDFFLVEYAKDEENNELNDSIYKIEKIKDYDLENLHPIYRTNLFFSKCEIEIIEDNEIKV
jgi:hypothetical protein